ncbi:MAG: SRPBCC family protein [Betaproteobacteria bacterium]
MQLADSFTLPFPRERVWQAFQDVEQLVACLPGASLDSPPVDGALDLTFAVKLGPMLAQFGGKGEVAFEAGGYRGRVSGAGADKRSNSRVKGEASFALAAIAENATRVEVVVDYALTGSLAQFSRGSIMKELASVLTRQFSQCLEARLTAASAAAHAAPDAADAKPAPEAAPQPVDGLRLLPRLAWAWFRSLFQRA